MIDTVIANATRAYKMLPLQADLVDLSREKQLHRNNSDLKGVLVLCWLMLTHGKEV